MKRKSVLSLICSIILTCTLITVPVNAENTDDSTSEVTIENQTVEETENNEQVEEEVVPKEPDIVITAGDNEEVTVPNNTTSVRSNNEDIVTVELSVFPYDSTIYVTGQYIGSTEIVLTDSNDKETTWLVVVKAPPFELSTKKLTISGSYSGYYYWNSHDGYSYTDDDGDDIYKTVYDYEPLYWIRSDDYYPEEYYEEYEDYEEPYYNGSGIQISPTTNTNIVSVKSSNTKVIRIDPYGYHTEYGYDDDGYETVDVFTLSDCFDIHPVGSGTATLTCKGQYGETATMTVTVTKGFMSSLLKKRSSYPNLKYGSKSITGKAPAGTVVSFRIGKKKYKATANSKGKYTIKKIPVYKIGTKIYYSMTYRGGKYSVTKKIIKPGTTISLSRVYRKTKTVKVTLKNVRKGEVFKLKIGKKTYKKKITKTAKKYTFKVKVKKKKKAGSKIKATVTNRYKQNVSAKSGVVYYASKIKKGMTKAQCKLVPSWGYPDEVSVSGKYTTWWYDDDGDGFAFDSALRFKKGKLIGWYY